MAYNTTVKRSFNISHFTLVCNVWYFLGSLPVKLLFEEKRLMLFKSQYTKRSCVFCPGVLRLCVLLSMNEDYFIGVCSMLDVHCNLPKNGIKNNIRSHFLYELRNEGLV